jgi:hypothetical protein
VLSSCYSQSYWTVIFTTQPIMIFPACNIWNLCGEALWCISQMFHLWLHCKDFLKILEPVDLWASGWALWLTFTELVPSGTLCTKVYSFSLIFSYIQLISNEFSLSSNPSLFSHLTSFLRRDWQGCSDGVYVYAFLEFYGFHYPKLCEIEGNTVGLNPGAICSTCSRFWWLTVY